MVWMFSGYFLFYLVKFYYKTWNMKQISVFLNSIKKNLKELYSSDWEFFSNQSLSVKIIKILLLVLGVIIVFILCCLYLIRLLLKYPISFLNKILDTEKENGFEFLKYVIFPSISGFSFVKYSESVKTHSNVLELIIKFYCGISKTISDYQLIILIMILFLFVSPYLLKFITKREPKITKDVFNYFSKWLQFITIMLLFILIVGAYFLLLEDLNNSQIDSYTIIPIFIAGCMTCSRIIIKFLTTMNKGVASRKPKRYPYSGRNY